jgi:hypothetical protein
LVFALIFMGGLARLTVARLDVIFGPDIIGSFLTEVLVMPILYVWLGRIVAAAPHPSDERMHAT